jgi:hypothetical protein
MMVCLVVRFVTLQARDGRMRQATDYKRLWKAHRH